MGEKVSLDSVYGDEKISLEDTHKAIWEMTKKQNPFQSLEALYEWVRGDMSVEMALAGIIENAVIGKRIVEIYMDEYEFEKPHFNLEIQQTHTAPLPVAKIVIPEMSFLRETGTDLDVLWFHKDYPLRNKELKVVANWLRKRTKSDKETYKDMTNLQVVRILWDAQAASRSFGQVSHR